MSKGIVKRATRTPFEPANNTQLELVRQSEGLQRLITADGPLSEQDKQDFRELTTARGADQYLVPNHLLAGDSLGVRPGTLAPQLAGTKRVLRHSQIVGNV